MTRIIHRNGWSTQRQGTGFSLIEVMVAVVVLATGLLALAALQGALARNSADAKARGAVAAAMISRLNEFRQAPPVDGTSTHTCGSAAWVCTAQTQGSIGSLTFTDNVATMIWKGGTFAALANGDDLTAAQFKRIAMSAQWTDAAGATRTMAMRSDVSAKVYGDGSGYPVNDPTGSASKFPIVRQDNPSNTAGVIPIVTGNQATAASNPQPIIEGADSNLRVGTSFDVLNYVPEGSVAKITKRFQTEVIKCRCKYGAGGYSVAGKAQWPTVWNGTTYEVYAGSGDATGVSANAGEDPAYDGTAKGGKKGAGREQSEQCTECCRDQHDATGSAAEAKYDPEASGVSKYDYNKSTDALTVQTNTTAGSYVASCRVVKVDGLWRTTADMYQRSYGLLETTDVGGVQAKSGIPSSAATSAYQNYVKSLLSLYTNSSTTPPGDPQGTFDGVTALNAPATINITTPSTTDYRYLHGRGLYVDYLTTKAQKAIEKCNDKIFGSTAYTECVLPALPFTTINLTEIASWTPSDTNVLAVNTNNTLYFNVTEPSGGRTAGINSGTATSDTESRRSNSGVAVSDDILGAVDDQGDKAVETDSQEFVVGSGSSGGSGDNYFWTRLIGAGASPGLTHTYGNCGKQGGDFQCTSSANLPQNLTLTISKYYTSGGTFNSYNFSGVTCTKKQNNDPAWVATTYSLPASYNTLQNMNISGVTLWDGSSLATGNISESGANANEVASLVLSNVPAMAATGYTPIIVNFSNDGSPVRPTVKSCVYSETKGNPKVIYIDSVVWNETWATN